MKQKIKQRKRYEKEIHEAMMKSIRILQHHIGQNYLRFANEVMNINQKYFDIIDKEKIKEVKK